MNKEKDYVSSISNTFKDLNWRANNIIIIGNNIHGCVSKKINIIPPLIYSFKEKINLTYTTGGFEGFYAASDFDSNDVYAVYKQLLKGIFNKDFDEQTIFVPCEVTKENTINIHAYTIVNDILNSYAEVGSFDLALKSIEKIYIDRVKSNDDFYNDNFYNNLNKSLIAIKVEISNLNNHKSIQFKNLFNDLVSFIYY